MIKNLSKMFHNGCNVCFNLKTLKSLHLLREFGDVVVTGSVVGSVETDGVFTVLNASCRCAHLY